MNKLVTTIKLRYCGTGWLRQASLVTQCNSHPGSHGLSSCQWIKGPTLGCRADLWFGRWFSFQVVYCLTIRNPDIPSTRNSLSGSLSSSSCYTGTYWAFGARSDRPTGAVTDRQRHAKVPGVLCDVAYRDKLLGSPVRCTKFAGRTIRAAFSHMVEEPTDLCSSAFSWLTGSCHFHILLWRLSTRLQP